MAGLHSRRGEIAMTEGSLYKNIFAFSVPLIFSQLLQVLFNMADVAVVGKFSSAMALGSVGSTSTLVTLFTGFLIGIGNGVNVLAARFMGLGDEKGLKDSVNTSFVICLITGVLRLAVGLLFSGTLLEVLKTKEELIEGAKAEPGGGSGGVQMPSAREAVEAVATPPTRTARTTSEAAPGTAKCPLRTSATTRWSTARRI